MESYIYCMMRGISVPLDHDVEQSPRVSCALNFNTVLSPLDRLSSFPDCLLQQASSLFPCPSPGFLLSEKAGVWTCLGWLKGFCFHQTHFPLTLPCDTPTFKASSMCLHRNKGCCNHKSLMPPPETCSANSGREIKRHHYYSVGGWRVN